MDKNKELGQETGVGMSMLRQKAAEAMDSVVDASFSLADYLMHKGEANITDSERKFTEAFGAFGAHMMMMGFASPEQAAAKADEFHEIFQNLFNTCTTLANEYAKQARETNTKYDDARDELIKSVTRFSIWALISGVAEPVNKDEEAKKEMHEELNKILGGDK